MDDITRVIEGLDEISGYDCQQMSLFDNDVFIRGMAQEAAELLKSQQEEIKRLKGENDLLKAQQPRVLSYKEVMESDFVFIELYTDEKDGVEPEFIRAIPLFISYSQPYFVTQYDICGHGTQEEYMCNWRCWTAIPTEEQRKAVPWKDGEQE